MRSMQLLVAVIAVLPATLSSGCGNKKPSTASVAIKPSEPGKLASRPATWLQISPRNVEVQPGEAVVFALRGFDNHDFEVKVRPAWSTTRGAIDRGGRLVSPAKKGISVVTAEDGISGLKAYTVVYVGQEPLPAPHDPEPKPKSDPEGQAPSDPKSSVKNPKPAETPPVAEKRMMVLLGWKVGGKGFRRRVVCSVACYARASRWVKLFAVSPAGKMSLLQSRFAKAGTTSNFSVDFPRAEVKWLEVRLYDRRSRLIARERRQAR